MASSTMDKKLSLRLNGRTLRTRNGRANVHLGSQDCITERLNRLINSTQASACEAVRDRTQEIFILVSRFCVFDIRHKIPSEARPPSSANFVSLDGYLKGVLV